MSTPQPAPRATHRVSPGDSVSAAERSPITDRRQCSASHSRDIALPDRWPYLRARTSLPERTHEQREDVQGKLFLRSRRAHGDRRSRPRWGYCHCTSCRQWSAGPVNAFTLWKPDAVKITKGADNIGTYNKTPTSFRKWCKTCGGHVLTEHPPFGLIDVYAADDSRVPVRAGSARPLRRDRCSTSRTGSRSRRTCRRRWAARARCSPSS